MAAGTLLTKEKTEEALKDLLHEIAIEVVKEKQAVLIVDFKQYFDRNGFLTESQQSVLKKIYEQHIGEL